MFYNKDKVHTLEKFMKIRSVYSVIIFGTTTSYIFSRFINACVQFEILLKGEFKLLSWQVSFQLTDVGLNPCGRST